MWATRPQNKHTICIQIVLNLQPPEFFRWFFCNKGDFMQRFLFLLYAIFIPVCVCAETINLDWKVDGENYAQTSCETGGNVTLPNSPTKHGYTFQGWAQNLWPGSTSASVKGSYAKTLNLPLGTYTFSAVVTLQSGAAPQNLIIATFPDSSTIRAYWRGDGARLYWVITNKVVNSVALYSGANASDATGRTILFSDIWLVSGNVTAQ